MSEKTVTCSVCHHHCRLSEGMKGFCLARLNRGGRIIPINYGVVTSIALDPIEKKPLYRFHPGSRILSVGSFGCNLACPFCQNHQISRVGEEIKDRSEIWSPKELLDTALSLRERGNTGIAFTYNEPLICYEFVLDTARLFKENGLATVLVTNGSVSCEILAELLPWIDAMNIDLKGFSQKAYDCLSGNLEQTKDFIRTAAASCHVELTSLIVPGINDSTTEMESEADFIADISPDIPLHITRYFPMYKMTSGQPTDISLLKKMKEIAEGRLKYVYLGNV
ncbi:MAG TPA: AmmeMemoRadiSam system radical SAM enzyme [Lachnospiraceae bacterium]|nr:AmmeMemoRadiSam system radical SAM enzyme [Lachnospiraceae bacterium]